MSSSSNLYEELTATAVEFVQSGAPRTPGGNDLDRTRLLNIRTSDCKTTWGPRYFVKARPPFQGEKDNEGFLAHMEGMAAKLDTFSAEVGRIIIDENKLEAVVQVDYHMTPAGSGSKQERTIVTDVVWFLTFSKDGHRVARAKEYVDAGASTAIMELMKKST